MRTWGGAIILAAALGLSVRAAAAPTYAGDGAMLNLSYITSYTSPTENLGASGNGAVLFAVVTSYAAQSFSTFDFAGTAMTLVGSAEIGGTTGTYVYVYDQQSPPASGVFDITPCQNTPAGLLMFSYSGVGSVASGAGTVINAANSYVGNSGNNQNISFNVTPATAGDVVVELLTQICSCSTAMNAYSATPGTLRLGVTAIGSEAASAFYDDAPGSTSLFSVSQTFNPQYNGMDVLGLSLDLEPAGTPTDTPSDTPSDTPTVTPTDTTTDTPTDSPTLSPSDTPTDSPTASPTGTPTATFTASPTASPVFSATASPTPTPSASPTATPGPTLTPTPLMSLTKSCNLTTATLGSTLTYTLTYKNDSNASVTVQLWDTVSSFLTYQGSSPAGTLSGGVISWSIPSVPAGTQGTVSFWGTVNGYP